MKNKIYKEIPGYNGKYLISPDGEVKTKKGNVLKWDTSNGYACVDLAYENFSNFRKKYVHRLVAITYIGVPGNPSLEIDHLDGNKLNNNLNNLEWVTHRENIARGWKRRKTSGLPSNIFQVGKKFSVMITVEGKLKYFGSYSDLNEAIKVKDRILNSLEVFLQNLDSEQF